MQWRRPAMVGSPTGSGVGHSDEKTGDAEARRRDLLRDAYDRGLECATADDTVGAEAWFRLAALSEDGKTGLGYEAAYELGRLLYRRRGEVEEDPRPWLRMASRMGHRAACDLLARIYREDRDIDGICEVDGEFASQTGLSRTSAGGTTPRRDEFEEHLRQDAEAGDVGAMVSLGLLLERTERRDPAVCWLTRASEHADAPDPTRRRAAELAIWALDEIMQGSDADSGQALQA